MNIVFITNEYVSEDKFDGGLASYLSRVAHSLVEFRHNVIILVASHKNEHFYQDKIHIFRVKCYNHKINRILKLLHLGRGGFIRWIIQSYLLNKKLKFITQKEKIDIVQYSNYEATALFVPKNVNYVIRISSYQKLWDKEQGKRYSLNSIICQYLDLKVLKKCNYIYSPSYLLANILSKKLNKTVYVLEPPFPRASIQLNDNVYNEYLYNKKYLLYYGRLSLYKGVTNIAEILPVLLSKYNDLYFAFIGTTMMFNRKSIVDYIYHKANNYKDRVLCMEKLRYENLLPIIKRAYAVVLPSRIDNLPNTCIEAMANNKIVIGTHGASFEQIIEDNVNGFLCKINNNESLLNSIDRVLSLDQNKKKEIELNAGKIRARLSPKQTTKNLLEFYKRIIEKK